MAKRWYVVQSKFNCEQQAYANLRAQRFDVFYPVYLRERKGKPNIFLPLFPSYMFVGLDMKRNRRWKDIVNTRGVYGIIGYTESHVRPVEKGYIEALKARLLQKGTGRAVVDLEKAVKQTIDFQPGTQIYIDGGHYDGVVATYCSSSENRVNLLLTLLNKPIRLSLDISSIRLKRK